MEYMKGKIPGLSEKYGKSKIDTGSTEVQVAILTERILHLTGHFKTHKKDNHSRRGLLKLVGHRKRMLNYLMKKDVVRFRWLKKELSIR